MLKSGKKTYLAIDLKSFYASVECMERGLDPLTTNLVVADESRTEKTICLAVSPALKAYGISGRARLFEVVSRVKELNATRSAEEAITYITAPPRMALYLDYSARIYKTYLQYIAPEDIHVYSIDEVMMDVSAYLKTYQVSAHELAMRMIKDVLRQTGITATAGIGSNLYLAKIAMDIEAKHAKPDEDGVRIAELDELSYRQKLWAHRPLTDFWRVGRGTAKKLEENGLYTMGDIARCSLGRDTDFYNEDLLYKLFGINAELLIDHAWGYEPCEMSDIKSYVPKDNCLSYGQVLKEPYTYEKGKMIAREMAELMALDLTKKGVLIDQVVLTVGYDIANLKDTDLQKAYDGEVVTDGYGRKIPKHAHGTRNLSAFTDSSKEITKAIMYLYENVVNDKLLIRRFTLTANHVIETNQAKVERPIEQLDFFSIIEEENDSVQKEKEERLQRASVSIQNRYGKNALVKGTSLQEGATTMERNAQIGGHKA